MYERTPDIPPPTLHRVLTKHAHRRPRLAFPPLRKFSKAELDLVRARMALAVWCSEGGQGTADREE